MITKKQEDEWRAEEDANTLARYIEIEADSKRKAAAMRVAKRKAAEAQKKADALKLASGGKLKK